ncbi:alpha/beta hydrolase [Brachybacterium phenoliresistens]|uniref:Esterase n=1 Tax=Brachybacterium phenoliresistens TaxID=396014 RepID=Z9JN14_9MICO|nr:alpha/beta hydrolase [Brachybacterium phenoliresistens]EWS79825.1 esterase [Brachybacterium phenoliresistens]
MGRIREAVMIGARTVRRLPMPSGVYTTSLREARRPLPPGAVLKRHAVDPEMIDRTRAVWLDRHRADRGVIVHLHGGAYVSGPFAGDWEWVSQLADAHECAALVIDYRFAPDHVHPVALDDAEAVIAALGGDVLGQAPWVLTGHNSGGGLALSIARRLRAQGSSVLPAGLVLMAPWTDLELANTGVTETGAVDPVHERRMLRAAARAYADRAPLDDPDLSPINADLHELPPVHLSAGTRDIFLTDTRILRLQLEELDVSVAYREVGGRISMIPWLRRSEDMARLVREQSAFIGRALTR